MSARRYTIVALVALTVIAALPGCRSAVEPETVIPGGWQTVKTTDFDVAQAATHALIAEAMTSGETLKLLSVMEARRQVVAGMNYNLKLAVERNGEKAIATAVVWAKLDGTHDLTKWTWE